MEKSLTVMKTECSPWALRQIDIDLQTEDLWVQKAVLTNIETKLIWGSWLKKKKNREETWEEILRTKEVEIEEDLDLGIENWVWIPEDFEVEVAVEGDLMEGTEAKTEANPGEVVVEV